MLFQGLISQNLKDYYFRSIIRFNLKGFGFFQPDFVRDFNYLINHLIAL